MFLFNSSYYKTEIICCHTYVSWNNTSNTQHDKAEVLRKLQENTEQYQKCEKVVVEHQVEKEKQRLREEQEYRERCAAVKVREVGGVGDEV